MGGFLDSLDQSAAPAAGGNAAAAVAPASFLGDLDSSAGVKPAPVDARKATPLTLGMDPAKFNAISVGIREALGAPSPQDAALDAHGGLYRTSEGLSITPDPATVKAAQAQDAQDTADVAAHPGYHAAGKLGAITLMGAAGGAEAPAEEGLTGLAKSMVKGGGLADLSYAGAEGAHQVAPDSKLAPLVGGLLFPAGVAGAATGIRSGLGAAIRSIIPAAADSPELQALSREQGIPLTVGDVSHSTGLNKLETVLESTPLSGMSTYREGQQQAVKAAAQNILAAADAKVPGEFGDLGGQVQAAVAKTMQQNKTQANQLYQAAADLAPNDAIVDLPNLRNAATSMTGTFGKNTDLVTPPAWVAQVQKLGAATPRSFEDVTALRKSIVAQQEGAGFGTPEAKAWKTVKDGLDQDMDAFAQQYPNSRFLQAQQDAKQFWMDHVAPFKDRGLSGMAYGRSDPDLVVSNWVKPNRPQILTKLMDNMDDQGKNALILGVLKKGFDVSNLESDAKPYSARAFTNYWNKLGTTKDVLFRDNPELRAQIDGYAKLVDAVPSPISNPPTGARNTGVMVGGALAGVAAKVGWMKALPILASGRGLTALLTSQAGQRLLVTAEQTKDPGLLRRLAVGAAMNLSATASNPGSVSQVAQKIQQPSVAASAPAVSQ